MNERTNPSIRCSVSSCTHHRDQHCTLNEIRVGCTKSDACTCEATECASFQLGSSNCGCK